MSAEMGAGSVRLKVVQPAERERTGLPRLLLWKRDLAHILGVGIRTLERMISGGEIPPPDRRLRGRPAWLARTIHEWAENGCVGETPIQR